MFGINGSELIILIVLALVLLGPERLPQYAQTLARWTRQARGMAEDAKKQFKEETGTDFDSVDWQKYDPRQYDPRRIIREALAEDYDEARKAVDSVKEAASLESPLKKPRSSGGRAARSGSARSGQSRAASARSAGSAGAAKRSSNASDPRSVFGSSQNGRKATGALAAGMAGSATSGAASSPRAAADSEEPTEAEATVPAPFDIDAT